MTTPAFPVIDLAMDFLREGRGERYVWVDGADDALGAVLDAIFSLDRDPLPLIDELLRFSCVLERELASPSAAALLLAVLGSDERVQALVSGHPDEEMRALGARWSGAATSTKRAPLYGDDAPEGTISAAALLEDRKNQSAEPIERTPKSEATPAAERASRRRVRVATSF